jgi:hypothetical protein
MKPGERLGDRFELEQPIARDPVSGEAVAVKVSDGQDHRTERFAREVKLLAGLSHPASCGSDTVKRLVKQADGNAFYLEELIRAVAEGKDAALPDTVLAMVEARLARLPFEARRVLPAASVFGEVCWESGVALLLGGAMTATAVGEWLTRMVEQEVLVARPDSRFLGERELAFRHASSHTSRRTPGPWPWPTHGGAISPHQTPTSAIAVDSALSRPTSPTPPNVHRSHAAKTPARIIHRSAIIRCRCTATASGLRDARSLMDCRRPAAWCPTPGRRPGAAGARAAAQIVRRLALSHRRFVCRRIRISC